MWVTKLLISPVKKRIFCPKTTKFGPKLAFLVNLGQAMQVFLVPFWLVGWWLWRAGCISQDTYLLYVNDDNDEHDDHDDVRGHDNSPLDSAKLYLHHASPNYHLGKRKFDVQYYLNSYKNQVESPPCCKQSKTI